MSDIGQSADNIEDTEIKDQNIDLRCIDEIFSFGKGVFERVYLLVLNNTQIEGYFTKLSSELHLIQTDKDAAKRVDKVFNRISAHSRLTEVKNYNPAQTVVYRIQAVYEEIAQGIDAEIFIETIYPCACLYFQNEPGLNEMFEFLGKLDRAELIEFIDTFFPVKYLE